MASTMTWSMLIMATAGILLFLIFVALLADMDHRLTGPSKHRCDWCGRKAPIADMQYRDEIWACPRCR
jgi:hypothetical protein